MSRIKIATERVKYSEKIVAGLSPVEFSFLKDVKRPIQDQLNELRANIEELVKSNSVLFQKIIEVESTADTLLNDKLYAVLFNEKVVSIIAAHPESRWNCVGSKVVEIKSHCEIGMKCKGGIFYKETLWMKFKNLFKG